LDESGNLERGSFRCLKDSSVMFLPKFPPEREQNVELLKPFFFAARTVKKVYPLQGLSIGTHIRVAWEVAPVGRDVPNSIREITVEKQVWSIL
jgi:hypothetical protein